MTTKGLLLILALVAILWSNPLDHLTRFLAETWSANERVEAAYRRGVIAGKLEAQADSLRAMTGLLIAKMEAIKESLDRWQARQGQRPRRSFREGRKKGRSARPVGGRAVVALGATSTASSADVRRFAPATSSVRQRPAPGCPLSATGNLMLSNNLQIARSLPRRRAANNPGRSAHDRHAIAFRAAAEAAALP